MAAPIALRNRRCQTTFSAHSVLSLDRRDTSTMKPTVFRILPVSKKSGHQVSIQTFLSHLKLTGYIIYIKRQRCCEDVYLFDNEGKFLISYFQLKRAESSKESEADLSQWGDEIFGLDSTLRHFQSTTMKQMNQDNKVQYSKGDQGSDAQNLTVHCDKALHLTQSPQLASCIVTTCKNSPAFLKSFHGFACHRSQVLRRDTKQCEGDHPSSGGDGHVVAPVGVVIHLRKPTHDFIDHAWEGRIQWLVGKKGVLDDAMSWLNTLGGGYSALGDYFKHHAEQAGKISMRQLRVAVDMGDPPTVIRCHLYFGLSLMQRGHLRQAKRMIRHQYQRAKVIAASDTRLVASCHGLWSRLQYLYSLRHQRREHPSG